MVDFSSAGLLLCKPLQLIYGMGGDSWSEAFDRFIEMSLWVVRMRTLKREACRMTQLHCACNFMYFILILWKCQTWIKPNLHRMHRYFPMTIWNGFTINDSTISKGTSICFWLKDIAVRIMLPKGRTSLLPPKTIYHINIESDKYYWNIIVQFLNDPWL